MRISGLLVIRRGNWLSAQPCNYKIKRQQAILYSNEEIISMYSGVEGLAWPEESGMENIMLENGLAPISCYEIVKEYFKHVSIKYPADFIYIYIPLAEEEVPTDILSSFKFLGYDYGIYLSEGNNYSVLYNEIIFGQYEEMRNYAKFLNNNLLFSSIDHVKELEKTRRELIIKGADLETEEEGEQFGPIMIYQPE